MYQPNKDYCSFSSKGFWYVETYEIFYDMTLLIYLYFNELPSKTEEGRHKKGTKKLNKRGEAEVRFTLREEGGRWKLI